MNTNQHHPAQADACAVRLRSIVALFIHDLLDAMEAWGDEAALLEEGTPCPGPAPAR
jgi:hypothetical protein